ncbi:MAG: Xenobiotic-transporting ATPase [Alphaproteobacteria bacterium]|nr:Xenobiotic-transporting ATPase [Alphaproteobacteria bacterium]
MASFDPDTALLKDWSKITVSALDFSYAANASSPALDHLSFDFRRGQRIALVGASGAGKSTLMSVLRGLYQAQIGTIYVDGKDFSTVKPLAAISTLIPQDPEIFENTIRYNITLGVEHSDEEILEACRIACFDTVLDDLPNGLDSKINEKGVNLSGGQKQRLALARGIFAIQESSLVLFDEPTSSVDSMTERKMYRNLFAAFPEICLISSIHRLNLLNQFDTIWVMQGGRLVQQGTLDLLLEEKDGPFYGLWRAYEQAGEE